MAFTAADVKKLRETTGVGMMDCKKALTETDGDMDKAIEWLREKGLATAQKKAGKIAAEGVSFALVNGEGVGVVVEVNAQTDFVAKNEVFQEYVNGVASVIADKDPADVETLMGLTYVQSGKNLTHVKQIIVTGGSLIHTENTEKIARHAQYSSAQPASLRPKAADVWVDRRYILAAMGLLSAYYPDAALRIMKKELEKHGYSE